MQVVKNKFEPDSKNTKTIGFNLEYNSGAVISDINSPTRDSQILYDRAGNSQDWGS